MLVSDFFATLSYGEISNLSMSGNGTGEIAIDEQGKVISVTNIMLAQLSKKFAYKSCYVK